MFSNKDVLETIAMVEKEHLDIRTITMGISLLSCIRDTAEETAKNDERDATNADFETIVMKDDVR